MIKVNLTRGRSPMRVALEFPATPADIGSAYTRLDQISTTEDTVVKDIGSSVANLPKYLRDLNLDRSSNLEKLNRLAEQIISMTTKERIIFAGALDANSINGLDDVLRIADRLDEYTLISNVSSDTELGRYVAVAGQIHGDPRFPEEAWPYLDFAKIGAEYYDEHGGAYTSAGYVMRKHYTEPEMRKDGALMSLQLETSQRVCILRLPAMDEELDEALEQLDIESFTQARVERVDFLIPYLEEHIPTECICVEDANDLALSIEEMNQHDGMLLKYLSVLEVEQPETMSDALRYATDIDNYERVPEDTDEYGRIVLRRIGADDEIIDTIDGYMDFAALGETAMEEDGVRRTDFGLIRRCSHPFPEETQSMQMGGM